MPPRLCWWHRAGILWKIIHRSEPFPFEDAIKSLSNIKMWAIKREKEKKHPPLLSYGTKLPHKSASVYACVVKEHKGSFADTERHSVKKVSDFICGYILCRSESLMFVIMIYHTKYVEPETSFRGDVDIHTTELTSVWHISISADMTLITIVKVYEIVLFPVVRVLAAFSLVRIELRRGFPFGTFPYTSLYLASKFNYILTQRNTRKYEISYVSTST